MNDAEVERLRGYAHDADDRIRSLSEQVDHWRAEVERLRERLGQKEGE